MSLSRWFRFVRVAARWAGLAFLGLIVAALIDGWTGFGKLATGERRARMERSPQWHGGYFENPQPLWNDFWGMMTGAFHTSAHVAPEGAIPTVPLSPQLLATPPASGLRVTWFGHSTVLV